jgi:hypothetical protein
MAYIPEEPYESLPDSLQELFGEIPGTDYIPSEDLREVEALYAIGFGFTGVEYDAMGLDPDVVRNAREQFFDYMRLAWDSFPWDEWKEAMGYE